MPAHKICILGGTGFVGHRLAAHLVEAGHQVWLPTRHRERHRDMLVLPTLQLVEGDIQNPVFLRRLFAGDLPASPNSPAVRSPLGPMDVVINLIGILNEKGRSGAGFARAHAELPAKVAEACRATGVRRLLHMSALHASLKSPSHYLRTKAMGEDTAHRAGGAGLNVTSFRPSVIFGPRDSFTNRFAALLRLAPGVFPLACPESRFQPVYVEDVARAFVGALDNRKTFGARYDLCGPKVYTLRQIVGFIAQQLGRRVYIVGLNDWMSRLQAAVLEFVPGKPFSLDNYRSLQVDSVCAEGKTAFTDVFGLQPASFEQIVPTFLGRAARDARLS